MGRKTDSGFKKDVWTELARGFAVKFGVVFQVSQFHTRGQAVRIVRSHLSNSSSCIRTTRSFKQLSIRVGLDGTT
jgi:hypothetical protein